MNDKGIVLWQVLKYNFYVPRPSLCTTPAGVFKRGRVLGPSDSPRRRPRCRDARQRSMALRGDHQLRIRISNPILLQQTVWTNIDEGVPAVKETGGSSVAHPPPNSD